MSNTFKEGKRLRQVAHYPECSELRDCIVKRHGFGKTEKIRRRNRKTWTRLMNKIRRRLDKHRVEESSNVHLMCGRPN